MTRNRRRLFLGPLLSLTALAAGAAVLSPAAAAAGGVTLKQYGWWLSANHDNTFTAPYSSVGPDAADMHVAYGPNIDGAENTDATSPVNGPVEVSAAFFTLSSPISSDVDPNIPVAQLKFALDTAYTPAASPQSSLLACPSLNPWFPDHGGNWNSRVTYNPGSACAPGQPDSSGSSFTFAITAGMLKDQGQSIDVAIVPGFTPIGVGTIQSGSTSPPEAPWTLDLKPPTVDDVTLQPVVGGTGLGDQFGLPQESSATVPTLGTSGLPGGPAVAAPPGQGPAGGAPVNRVPTSLAGTPAARLAAMARGRLLAGGLLLLLFLGGLVLMGLDVQKLLTPAGQTSGIGRFARPRTGPPLPI